MTLQASDLLLRDGERYQVLDSSGPLFEPAAHGYRPVMCTTACLRGYLCEFELRDGALRLHALDINHQQGSLPIARRKQPPELNGVVAAERAEYRYGPWRFEGVALPLAFTGGVLVGFDQVATSRLGGGWRGAWLYRQVRELAFESGRLVEEVVLDDRIAPIREHALAVAKRSAPLQDVDAAALSACFSFDYDAKR